MVTRVEADQYLPLEFVFNPNWWNKTAGISFDESFYFDPKTREQHDVTMRRVLFEQLGKYGFGEENPQPRPVAGSLHVAGGFIVPAVLGAEIRFSAAEAPQPLPHPLSREEIAAFKTPAPLENEMVQRLLSGWNEQRKRYGYLIGDMNTGGILNDAYHFYGGDLFADMLDAPELPVRFMNQIADLIISIVNIISGLSTGKSISVNRMAARLTPTPFIHSNCSVQMISPRLYRKAMLPMEQRMAPSLQPYGVHHCGIGMERYAGAYAQIPVSYCDVGWGSDTRKCREQLPDAFLGLRLNPVRMLTATAAEIRADLQSLLDPLDSLDRIGVCCINMDAGTPMENLVTVCEMIEEYRRNRGKA